jgi:hypothetical protein
MISEGTWRNWYHFYRNLRELTSSFEFSSFLLVANHTARLTKSTGSTATLQIHGRCNTNLIKIDRQSGSFWIDSGTHNTHPLSQKYVESTAMEFFFKLPVFPPFSPSFLCY